MGTRLVSGCRRYVGILLPPLPQLWQLSRAPVCCATLVRVVWCLLAEWPTEQEVDVVHRQVVCLRDGSLAVPLSTMSGSEFRSVGTTNLASSRGYVLFG